MNPITFFVFVAFIGFIQSCTAFDSSEIRMIEDEYNKRGPLNRFLNDFYMETQKRARLDDPLIRFGKRSVNVEREIRNGMNPLIRFGKRASLDSAPLVRFGRASLDSSPLIRFGKRPDTAPLIRFGKRSPAIHPPHIRFGKRVVEESLYNSRNRPNPADQDVMLRFGRSTPATMTLDEEK
uniref:Uncharacterized protein n=1 Tax=Panagrolaimus sp. JU765 TaxID=591449 RepID=A0AC34RII5_9BILA